MTKLGTLALGVFLGAGVVGLGAFISTIGDGSFWEKFGDIATWVGAAVNFAVVLLALTGDRIREHYLRPILEVEVSLREPFFSSSSSNAGWMYFQVTNIGRSSATNLECYVMSVVKLDGGVVQRPELTPQKFRLRDQSGFMLERLVSGTSQYFEFLRVWTSAPNPNGEMELTSMLEAQAWNGTSLSGGLYRVDLMIASDQGVLFRGNLEFRLKPGPYFAALGSNMTSEVISSLHAASILGRAVVR